MITAEDIRARAKIKSVKDQILKARSEQHPGILSVIECPYCGIKNPEGDGLCCETLRKCVTVILMGMRQERIEEKTSVN
jgi:hypothetical protein